jgi:DNA-binding MarR family transcriptional regulator
LDTKILAELEMLLREINHQINLYTRCFLNEKGITMSRFWVMNKLSLDKPITMKDLQKKLLLAPATLTGLIDNLVDDMLVKRWRDDNDRRLVYLTLTPEGHKLLSDILQCRISIFENSLKNLDEINIEQINDDLRLILNRIKKTTDELP